MTLLVIAQPAWPPAVRRGGAWGRCPAAHPDISRNAFRLEDAGARDLDTPLARGGPSEPRDVSAVDVFGMKDTPGCESARFYHQILNANMTVRATWWDSGAFNLCSGKNKSFLWHHAGKGAFVPNHGFVVGYLVVGKRTYRTAYIPQAEL